MLKNALRNMPNYVCIVPEKRKEITTEGGIDLKKNFHSLKEIISRLNKAKIRTSLFIDPSKQNIEISKKIGTKCVELHTGKISILVKKGAKFSNELKRIKDVSKLAFDYDIEVHAGHGLDYKTTKILRKIQYIKEFNIGHFIIGESLESGMSSIIKKLGGKFVGVACLIDRSKKLKMSKKIISQVKLDIPVYKRNKLPTSLKNIQITKPGSRYLR